MIGRLLADQRVRFLLVGGFNTALGFATFIAADLLVGRPLDTAVNEVVGSLVSLAISYLIGVSVAFWLYRRFVFETSGGSIVHEFLRFVSVYIVQISFNAVALPLVVSLGAPRIPAQFCILVVSAVGSYVGHRYFSFRRAAP